jgi:hypothetical protein
VNLDFNLINCRQIYVDEACLIDEFAIVTFSLVVSAESLERIYTYIFDNIHKVNAHIDRIMLKASNAIHLEFFFYHPQQQTRVSE